jgi:hypothetical protein
LYVGRPAAYWFTAASTSGGRFPSPSVTDPSDRPPTLSNRVHSLVPSVLFGVPSPAIPARPCPTRHSRIESRQAAAPAKDFVPHRDITGGVHDSVSGHGHAGFPGPTSFRPRAFSAPRRLAPPPASRACFIPQPRPGFGLRPGVSPDSQRATARHRRLPPCRSAARTHRQAGCHTRLRRLRGVAPRIDAFREFGG